METSYSSGGNGNGNGNGKEHQAPFSADRFSTLDVSKPRLFASRKEVLKKNGITKNLILFTLFVSGSLGLLALPQTQVTDPRALVHPVRRVDFTSPSDGFVTQVFFKEGDSVKAGALLLEVSSREDQSKLRQAELETRGLRREFAAQKIEKKFLALRLEETHRLKELGSVDERALEEAFLLVQAKAQRIGSLRSRLREAEERVVFFRQRILEGQIRAPFEGRIISDPSLKEKSFVKEGDFLLTLASRLSQVEARIKEGDYARIPLGAEARVKFYAFPERTYEGRVTGFKHFAEPLPKSGIAKHAIKALIRLEEVPPGIQNGMSAKVTLEVKPESFLRRFYHEMF